MMFISLLLLLFASASDAFEQLPEMKVTQLADNVYQHVSYKKVGHYGVVPASGLVVFDGENAYIIDTPWTLADTKKLVIWVEAKGARVKASVSTHFHQDASKGIAALNELSIKTYVTTLTNQLLKAKGFEQASYEIQVNDFVLAKGLIEIYYPGGGHTKDNIVVWLNNSKILFGGCFVKNLKSKSLGYTKDANIQAWPVSIENVLDKYPHIDKVVPGHGAIGDVRLLQHTKQLALSADISDIDN